MRARAGHVAHVVKEKVGRARSTQALVSDQRVEVSYGLYRLRVCVQKTADAELCGTVRVAP